MKEIKLTQGFSAIVDDADFEKLSMYKWLYHQGYAARKVREVNGKQREIGMHVDILGNIYGFEIDHINGNTLDNRRENLRHATHTQNTRNSTSRVGRSGFKGVSLRAGKARWIACIMFDGKRHYLGSFLTELDAAIAYNEAATKYFGEYARLNPVCPCDEREVQSNVRGATEAVMASINAEAEEER